MAKITQLYQTPPHGDSGMDEYKKKLFRHRAGLGARFIICAAVLLAVILGFFIWSRNRTYTGYEVVSSVEHSTTLNTQYAEYNGQLLRYSRDGITCVNSRNEAVWSQTYNMQSPILDICGSTAAVADQQGNEVYVFDSQGLLTQITTLLPIQQISVSSQGVTAVLLNDSSVSWIYLYDSEGNMLAESRCSLDETGQPLSISLSSDGTKLAVSYLQIQDGVAASCIVFYNFSSVGANFVDKIVSSQIYAETLIPRVKYLGSSVCAAVSDQGIIFYEGAEIPEETVNANVEEDILSVFFGTDKVGIITEGSSGTEGETADTDGASEAAGRYQISIYDTNGKLTLTEWTDLKYTQAKFSQNMLILYNDTECEIYSAQGVLKYAGTFDTAISDICKGAGWGRYIVVFSDRTDTIRLK